MAYLHRPIIQYYLDEVTPTALEDAVDQLWINILRYFFNNLDHFGIEAQSKPDPNLGYKCNIVVTNLRNHMLAKFLFVENKRSELENNQTSWDEARDQLEDYVLGSRRVQGNIQTLYGIVGIGQSARFYVLPRDGIVLIPFGPVERLHTRFNAGIINTTLQYLVTTYR
ncbi:hypothetical protein Plec18170_009155 [Paecilomyces lecythidis]